ncbi:hypothetical protein EDD18DRAFT_1110347 [Armillaria luteobubalina]|uniref:Uncharacterized protein n=1 Tax=Armillaria luteobubalina TaxID=153913 RepID=A0AA39PRA7_9AGAR|nr:hypothetical protein EDD18DRAFT_1110347 [Armillaria luteobubalina]
MVDCLQLYLLLVSLLCCLLVLVLYLSARASDLLGINFIFFDDPMSKQTLSLQLKYSNTLHLLDEDPYCQIVITMITFANSINVKTLLDSITLGWKKDGLAEIIIQMVEVSVLCQKFQLASRSSKQPSDDAAAHAEVSPLTWKKHSKAAPDQLKKKEKEASQK